MAHTYRFTYDGKTYTRTTYRLYTHAAVLYQDWRYTAVGSGVKEHCTPFVVDVRYGSTEAGARRAKKRWHSDIAVIVLEQPEG